MADTPAGQLLRLNANVTIRALNVTGPLTSDDGFTGSCIDTNYVGGIAVSCND